MTAAEYREVGGEVSDEVPDFARFACDDVKTSAAADPNDHSRVIVTMSPVNPRWEWVSATVEFAPGDKP
jgi:hypothetical protein